MKVREAAKVCKDCMQINLALNPLCLPLRGHSIQIKIEIVHLPLTPDISIKQFKRTFLLSLPCDNSPQQDVNVFFSSSEQLLHNSLKGFCGTIAIPSQHLGLNTGNSALPRNNQIQEKFPLLEQLAFKSAVSKLTARTELKAV